MALETSSLFARDTQRNGPSLFYGSSFPIYANNVVLGCGRAFPTLPRWNPIPVVCSHTHLRFAKFDGDRQRESIA